MESAIPRDLAAHRTEPAGMKSSWQPPYPSFVARFAPTVESLVGHLVAGR